MRDPEGGKGRSIGTVQRLDRLAGVLQSGDILTHSRPCARVTLLKLVTAMFAHEFDERVQGSKLLHRHLQKNRIGRELLPVNFGKDLSTGQHDSIPASKSCVSSIFLRLLIQA